MLTSKQIDRLCITVTAFALVIALLCMGMGNGAQGQTMGYEQRLFDNERVHTIDIVMDDWDGFIETCESEEYSSCAVVIDGESIKNVAIRAKGNTSLSSVRSMGSQRYSLKLEFDHYQSDKSYYGLDKLCLNNLIQDNTMMKDYVVYRLMAEFGVDTPLCSFVYVTVNGEDWGLFLAVEGVEDSFLMRNYGTNTGELYKPDSMSFGGGRGNGRDFDFSDFDVSDFDVSDFGSSDFDFSQMPNMDGQMPDMSDMPDMNGGQIPDMSNKPNMNGGQMPDMSNMPDMNGGQMPNIPDMGNMPDMVGQMPDMGGQMPDMNSGEIPQMPQTEEKEEEKETDGEQRSSRQASFDRGNFDFGNFGGGGMGGFGGMGSSDVKLQYIDDDPASYSNIFNNAKTDITEADKDRLIASLKKLSEYEDIESVVDMDEVLRYFVVHGFVCNGDSYTGQMIHNYYLRESDGVLSMIPWDYNLAFGTFMGGNAQSSINTSIDELVSGSDSRPMADWIFSDEEYTEMYHELYREFSAEWLESGRLKAMIEDTAAMINEYVQKDPTRFCTYEEYQKGVTALTQYAELRGESVIRQLNGDESTVDASSLNLSDMGTMGNSFGSGRGGGMDFGFDRSSFGPGNTEPDDEEKPMEKPEAEADSEEKPEAIEKADDEQRRNVSFDRGSLSAGQTGKTDNTLLLGVSVIVLLLGIGFALWMKH